MRIDPPPNKYRKQGLSPLHLRVMPLFDTLNEFFHHGGFNNLYNSVNFCRSVFNHEKKVLVHGVTSKGGRGIPECVTQEEVKTRTAISQVRGRVKVAKLEGDDTCPHLIASSIYDTKPVHYLSMVSDKIEWVVKEKPVYNVNTGRTEQLRFLRLNQIDIYNFDMGNVDIADQLRAFYCIDT